MSGRQPPLIDRSQQPGLSTWSSCICRQLQSQLDTWAQWGQIWSWWSTSPCQGGEMLPSSPLGSRAACQVWLSPPPWLGETALLTSFLKTSRWPHEVTCSVPGVHSSTDLPIHDYLRGCLQQEGRGRTPCGDSHSQRRWRAKHICKLWK